MRISRQITSTLTSTLKGRLSLWYLATVGTVLALSLVVLGGLFWITLKAQIDHHVHIAVNEARQIVQDYRGQERDTLIKNLLSARGMTVVVLSPDGTAVLETNSPNVAFVTEHQLQKIVASSDLARPTPVHFTEGNMRFAALPVTVSAGRGVVAVGYSTQVLTDTLYKMLGVVVGVLIFLVLPMTLLGYRLLEKQLRPLESIARQARSVGSATSLSRRISLISPTQELKTIQMALNTMLDQLENIFRSEREFFADAAHTLKTPLAVLRSQIESAGLTPKVRKKLLQTIDNSNHTIQDLLFLAQISKNAGPQEIVSLTKMLAGLSELAAALGEEKGLKVLTSLPKDVRLKTDRKLLQRALGNIVHNAVLYNKPQGLIYLDLKKKAGKIIIRVKDTGIGIPRHDLPQVFTRFFRGKNAAGKGSGLGLPIAKAAVESLGGKINLVSSLNKGTTVLVTLS